MARRDPSFICQNCGAVYGRWQGKCDACGEWNTIAEENAATARPVGARTRAAQGPQVRARAARRRDAGRAAARIGIAEFDRVTGGGFVRGSVLLLGGDPGIGKSTLLIQVAAALARARPARGLHLGRGGGRAGAAARRAARPRRRRGRARRRDLGRGHRRDAVRGRDAAPRHHRLRSRPCGPTWSSPRPAPSPRCAPARRR